MLANSDCPMEDQTAIEHLRETLLTSLHEVVTCVRAGNTKHHVDKILLLLPCLRHIDALIRLFWAKIKQVLTLMKTFWCLNKKIS